MSEPTQDGLGPLFNAPDAGNQGPGDMLRRAREAQRISIEVMAANIKVSVAKLEALESGRYDMLPDANFTRALAMTLCRVLKIDAAPVLAAMPAARPITLVSDVPPLNQPFKASRASMSLFDHRVVNWSNFLKPQWLSPAALLLAAVVLYRQRRPQRWRPAWQTWPAASRWPRPTSRRRCLTPAWLRRRRTRRPRRMPRHRCLHATPTARVRSRWTRPTRLAVRRQVVPPSLCLARHRLHLSPPALRLPRPPRQSSHLNPMAC